MLARRACPGTPGREVVRRDCEDSSLHRRHEGVAHPHQAKRPSPPQARPHIGLSAHEDSAYRAKSTDRDEISATAPHTARTASSGR